MKPARKLEDMKNIGPAMANWLRAAGIGSPEQVEQLGAVECYRKISKMDKNASNRMALYALYGAIHNENCIHLPPEVKDMLEAMLQESQTSSPPRCT